MGHLMFDIVVGWILGLEGVIVVPPFASLPKRLVELCLRQKESNGCMRSTLEGSTSLLPWKSDNSDRALVIGNSLTLYTWCAIFDRGSANLSS